MLSEKYPKEPASKGRDFPVPRQYIFRIFFVAVLGEILSIYFLYASAMSGKTDDTWLSFIGLMFFSVVLLPFIGYYLSMKRKDENNQ